MYIFATLLTILLIAFYYLNHTDNYKKDILFMIMILGCSLIWIILLLIDYSLIPIYIKSLVLIIILGSLFFIYKYNQSSKNSAILAEQESYWDIDFHTIKEKYMYRKKEYENRIELISEDFNKLHLPTNKEILSTNILKKFIYLENNFKLTKIDSIHSIIDGSLYWKVFEKIKKILKEKEIDINLQEELSHYENILEFFIMSLWEKYTLDINLSIAQLEGIATNENEREFINALDNIQLKNIKFEGAYLLYKFDEFKERKINE